MTRSPSTSSAPVRPVSLPAGALPFAGAGTAGVVAGGLVAAVTAAAPSEHGTWAAAFLVLVVGVGQIGLGVGQAALAPRAPGLRLVGAELVTWNLGCLAVLAGTLVDRTGPVDGGGALLVVALALFIAGVRRPGAPRGGAVVLAYRLLAAVLLVSVPVGLLLARTSG